MPCGSLRSFDDVGGFVERLFCETDFLAVRCFRCHEERHKKLTKEESKNGI